MANEKEIYQKFLTKTGGDSGEAARLTALYVASKRAPPPEPKPATDKPKAPRTSTVAPRGSTPPPPKVETPQPGEVAAKYARPQSAGYQPTPQDLDDLVAHRSAEAAKRRVDATTRGTAFEDRGLSPQADGFERAWMASEQARQVARSRLPDSARHDQYNPTVGAAGDAAAAEAWRQIDKDREIPASVYRAPPSKPLAQRAGATVRGAVDQKAAVHKMFREGVESAAPLVAATLTRDPFSAYLPTPGERIQNDLDLASGVWDDLKIGWDSAENDAATAQLKATGYTPEQIAAMSASERAEQADVARKAAERRGKPGDTAAKHTKPSALPEWRMGPANVNDTYLTNARAVGLDPSPADAKKVIASPEYAVRKELMAKGATVKDMEGADLASLRIVLDQLSAAE